MIARFRREISIATTYAALLLVLAFLVPDFFQAEPLSSLAVSSAPVLVAAIGMTLVIVARQIDISIGWQFSICAVIAGLLAQFGLPMPIVCLCTIGMGAGFGAINGLFIAGLGLPPIVVTLATMVILRESLRWLREGQSVRDLPSTFQWFGAGQTTGQWLVVAIALIVFVVFSWASRNLDACRAIYATGSDPEAAHLAGIRPRIVIFNVYVTMGMLCGLASLLNAVRFANVEPNSGMGLELQAIAAVVVGGTAISGGRGTLIGTFIGVMLLATIGPALVFLGIQPQWEKAIQGLVILLAVASDAFYREGK